jgi:hypothetical protein
MIDTKEIEERVYQCDGRRNMLPLISIAHECIDHVDSLQDENTRLKDLLKFEADGKERARNEREELRRENKRLTGRINEAMTFLTACKPENLGDEVLIRLLSDALKPTEEAKDD